MTAHESEPPESRIELPEPAEPSSSKGWPATVIVSMAAVAVTALVGILGIINTRSSQHYEEEKSEREFRLSCVTSAATIAQMAFALSKDFASMPDDEKVNQINIIIASFPPDTANRFLSALAPRMGNAQPVIRAFQVAQDNAVASVEADKRLTCPSATQLIGTNEANAGPGAQITPQPPQAQANPSRTDATATTTAPTAKHKLTVYYQVTQSADLRYAGMIAKDVADATDLSASFPSAGVDLVAAVRPLGQTEVRYYRLEQEDAALDLRNQLRIEAKAMSLDLNVQAVYIGARYPNLPSGRMEVWFQPLVHAHQG